MPSGPWSAAIVAASGIVPIVRGRPGRGAEAMAADHRSNSSWWLIARSSAARLPRAVATLG